MDLLVDTTRPNAGAMYLEHADRLVALGARRFLLFGLSTRAVDLLARFDARKPAFALTVAIVDHRTGTPGLAGCNVRCMSPEQAIAESWDAIFAWEPETAAGAFLIADIVAQQSGRPPPHVVYAGRRARAVLVAAIPKCGTHLVSRVMTELGYEVHVPPNVPEELWTKLKHDPFALPDNVCFVPPGIRLGALFEKPIQRWHDRKDPAVVVNYRDPRDALCSYVHYLMSEAREPATPTPANTVHGAILRALPTQGERLLHAIEDPTFPFRDLWDQSAWMLKHPLVCKARFEKLVGASGGGSDAEQVSEVRALMRHVRAPGEADAIAAKVFDRSQRTFRKGQIGAWREEFGPAHTAAFAASFPRVLERYGYDATSPAAAPAE